MRNIDHLLKDRYMLTRIPPIPVGLSYGEILTLEKGDNNTFYEDSTMFKRLQWWEARDISQMPDYIEVKNGQYSYILKVYKYLFGAFYYEIPYFKYGRYTLKIFDENMFPATKEQYEQYLEEEKERRKKPF